MAAIAPSYEQAAAQPLLRLEGIVKQFPGVRALDGVDFELRAGEVHVLFGENGAGKSTIINILAGTFGADTGRYTFDGQPVTNLTPVKARRLGIQPVFQESRGGGWKVISFAAKRARGRMARFAIEHRVDDPRQLEAFDEDGYRFAPHASTHETWVFRRAA